MRVLSGITAGLLSLAFAMGTTASAAERLIPMGTAVGVRLFSDGVMVVGTTQVEADGEKRSPAQEGGLEKGDIITHVNENEVGSVEQLKTALCRCGGDNLSIVANRGGKQVEMELTPVISDGGYRLGVWIRDSMAGIGTMTYYDPETGEFGALGHGVNDVDTGQLLPLATGTVLSAGIASVKKGIKGLPGQLQGSFDTVTELGTVTANTDSGIFGKLNAGDEVSGEAMETAGAEEIENGPAYILSAVQGNNSQLYTVEITRQSQLISGGNRDMVVKVTDPRLLELTGGIVQGMSGSPIIQNGKLIGAVTHVLVNDPTKGYGIYIENMLSEISRVQSSES